VKAIFVFKLTGLSAVDLRQFLYFATFAFAQPA
jgi:hypothetical protein